MKKLLILLGLTLTCLSGMAAIFQNGKTTETVMVNPKWDANQNRYVINYDEDPNGVILHVMYSYLTWKQNDNEVVQLIAGKMDQTSYDGKTYGSLYTVIVQVEPGNIITIPTLTLGLGLIYDEETATFSLPEGYALALGAFNGDYADKATLNNWIYVYDLQMTYKGGGTPALRDYDRAMMEGNWELTLTDRLNGASGANPLTGEGTMTANLDSESGSQQTYTIPTSYLGGQLTLSKLGDFTEPITFSVNLKTGAVTSTADQVAVNQNGTNYYYRSFSNTSQGISGTLTGNGDGKTCRLTLNNWEALNSSNQKTGNVYYNTKIELPYYIPDLPKTPDIRTGNCHIRTVKDNKLEEWDVKATYDADNYILTIDNFGGPDMYHIYFKVPPRYPCFCEAPAGQEAYTDVTKFVYSSNSQGAITVYPGLLQNVSPTQSRMEIQSTYFTMSASFGATHTYQNTTLTLDFTIPHLPAYEEGGGTRPEPDDPTPPGNYNGEMTYNADNEKGDYRSCKVNGEFDTANNTLTITNFGGNSSPIKFNVTLDTGAAVANAGQLVSTDDTFGKIYFTGSSSDASTPINAVYTNDGYKSRLEIEPVFTKSSLPGVFQSYYNSVIFFDFTVDGLAEYEAPEVREPLSVEGEWYFTIVVDDYNGNLYNGTRDEKYTATFNPDDNSLYFEWEESEGRMGRYPDFKGIYNENTGVISFPNNDDVAVKYSARTLYQRPMFYNMGSQYWVIRPIEAQFSAAEEKKAEKIYFNSNEGFIWYETPDNVELDNVLAGPIIFATGYREGGNIPEPPKVKSLALENVKCEVIDSTTAQYEFDVVSQYLEEDAPITAYYTFFEGTIMPSEVQYEVVPESADGHYIFTLKNLKPETTYGVRIYAEGDGLTTDVKRESFKTPAVDESGVDTIGMDETEVRYFTPQGFEVREPATGEIYIRVSGNKAEKIRF